MTDCNSINLFHKFLFFMSSRSRSSSSFQMNIASGKTRNGALKSMLTPYIQGQEAIYM